MRNWRDRYGTDLFNADGTVAVKGDLARLTPKQRRRCIHKENRYAAPAVEIVKAADSRRRISFADVSRLRFGRRKRRADLDQIESGSRRKRSTNPRTRKVAPRG